MLVRLLVLFFSRPLHPVLRSATPTRRFRRLALALTVAVGGTLAAAPAQAATTVVAKGAGFGHGIGMSQYGAYGQAKAGRSAAQILALYYQGTALAAGDSTRSVRVLLRSAGSARIQGASAIEGSARTLSPTATYVLKRSGGTVTLSSSKGKKIASASGAIRVTAPAGGSIMLAGRALNGITGGRYRGAIELRDTYVINQLTLEDYVRGVVAGESPASWPAAALQAQAIAARTYAITTAKSAVFDHYPDTRSQVYRGVTGETATTDAAVAATAGKLVTYNGKPIPTYFFSTSGGQTENVENSFLGATPQPYLRSVKDPWDTASPKHTWQVTYTRASLQRKLGGWVKGTLKSVDVIKRGVSPRVVRADVVGSKGRTSVSGPQLRARLGLNDTWVQFVFVGATTKPVPTTPTEPTTPTTPTPTPTASGGGVSARGARAGGSGVQPMSATSPLLAAPTIGAGLLSQVIARPPGYGAARGRVWPEGGNRVVRLQLRTDGRWRTSIRVRTDAAGNWTSLIPVGTRYRVVALGVAGPVVTAH